MALTLRVTSFHSQALGAQAVKTFGTEGGSIGRKPDNDWVLPDPERFISGCHAEIACRGGAFYLRDTSVNGTFVNGAPQPIGSGREHPLSEGDRLQIGEYEVTVSFDSADQDFATGPTGFDTSAGGAYPSGPSSPSTGTGPYGGTGPTSGPGFGGQDLGQPSSVDPLDFFGDGASQSSTTAPDAQSDHASTMEEYYRPPPVEQAPPRPPPSAPMGGDAFGIPEDWDKTGYSPSSGAQPPPGAPDPAMPPPPPGASPPPPPGAPPMSPGPPPAQSVPPTGPPAQSVPPTGPPPAQSAPPPGMAPAAAATGDAAGMLAAILQAAGLDAQQARAAVGSPDLANHLGMLLGVVVQGMVEVLKARMEVKSQFRVPVTMMRPVENNPLKFSATPAQALQTLLDQNNQAYLGPVEAFSEGFQDIKAHQVAMMAGMRAAFDSMIQRFDPEELAQRFEKRLKRGALLSMPGKGRYWDMYRDLYEEWTQDADVNFQRLFGDEFARAYEEQMRRLTATRR